MIKRWGFYITLLKGKHFKVKMLYFKEGGAISMQLHHHRNELWLFIFGRGKWKTKSYEQPVRAGDCMHVAINRFHQYIAEIPTLVLECQYGGKCSEKDIERD